ncbi:MAG: protein kinase, partial [Myxococcota bacterium]
ERGYQLDVALPSLDIPSTLRDSLVARLDRLPSAKLVVQVAAAIGRQFAYSLLRDVLELDDPVLERELDLLIEAGLLRARGKPPECEYSFGHALLQDAAYDSLLRRTRQKYHLAIAEVLESRFPDTAPEILAHHYSEAGKPTKAITLWHSAGQAALGAWALAEAMQHLGRGLELNATQPPSPERTADELSLRVAIGVPLMLSRGYAAPEVEETYRRAFELCSDVGDSAADRLFPALWGLWIYYQVKADYPQAEKMGERLLDLAERSGVSDIAMGAHQALGATRFWRGRVAAAQSHFEYALASYDADQHGHLVYLFGQDARVFCLAFLIWVHWHNGDIERARACRREALRRCEDLGQPGSNGFAQFMVATFHCLVGEYALAQGHAQTLIVLSEQQGMPHWEAYGRIAHAWASVAHRGSDAELARDSAVTIRAGIDALITVGGRTSLSVWLSALVEAELRGGRADRAQAALDELSQFVQSSAERCYVPEFERLSGQVLLAAGGDERAAAGHFRRARD